MPSWTYLALVQVCASLFNHATIELSSFWKWVQYGCDHATLTAETASLELRLNAHVPSVTGHAVNGWWWWWWWLSDVRMSPERLEALGTVTGFVCVRVWVCECVCVRAAVMLSMTGCSHSFISTLSSEIFLSVPSGCLSCIRPRINRQKKIKGHYCTFRGTLTRHWGGTAFLQLFAFDFYILVADL